MIFPFSSCFANKVPLNSLDRNFDIELPCISIFLNIGNTDNSFAIDKIGPGIPVSPVIHAVLLEHAISLTR